MTGPRHSKHTHRNTGVQKKNGRSKCSYPVLFYVIWPRTRQTEKKNDHSQHNSKGLSVAMAVVVPLYLADEEEYMAKNDAMFIKVNGRGDRPPPPPRPGPSPRSWRETMSANFRLPAAHQEPQMHSVEKFQTFLDVRPAHLRHE